MNDEHTWFRSHLADHLLDLMDESAASRLRDHASACSACGALLAVARSERPDSWLGADHPSPSSLVRWQRDDSAFEDSEARTMREHLGACAACRVDLAELSGEKYVHPATEASAPAPIRWHRISRWSRDLTSGAIGAAMATAAAFLIVGPRARVPSTTPLVPPAAPTAVSARPITRTEFLNLARPVHVHSPSRSTSETTLVVLDRSTAIVPIRIPALFVPDSTRLAVELVGASRTIRSELPAGIAERIGLMLDVRGLDPGHYTLDVSWRENGHAQSRRYPIAFEFR